MKVKTVCCTLLLFLSLAGVLVPTALAAQESPEPAQKTFEVGLTGGLGLPYVWGGGLEVRVVDLVFFSAQLGFGYSFGPKTEASDTIEWTGEGYSIARFLLGAWLLHHRRHRLGMELGAGFADQGNGDCPTNMGTGSCSSKGGVVVSMSGVWGYRLTDAFEVDAHLGTAVFRYYGALAPPEWLPVLGVSLTMLFGW